MEQEILGSSPQGYSKWFILITAVFITSLVTANIIAVKLISIFGLVLPAAIIIFPISYIAGDVLTEVYGYAKARQVIWLGVSLQRHRGGSRLGWANAARSTILAWSGSL